MLVSRRGGTTVRIWSRCSPSIRSPTEPTHRPRRCLPALGARREYRTADSLFPGDRYLNGANAIFLIGIGDTAAAVTLIDRARQSTAGERMTLRAKFLLELTRGRRAQAAAIADSASRRFAGEQRWYSQFRQ